MKMESYVASLAQPDDAEQRRILRKEQQARREAKFDLSRGSSMTPVDADAMARDARKPLDKVYWKEYGSELRRQRGQR